MQSHGVDIFDLGDVYVEVATDNGKAVVRRESHTNRRQLVVTVDWRVNRHRAARSDSGRPHKYSNVLTLMSNSFFWNLMQSLWINARPSWFWQLYQTGGEVISCTVPVDTTCNRKPQAAIE